jgi:hypothetical protein
MALLNKADNHACSVSTCASRKPLIVRLIIIGIVVLDSSAILIAMSVSLHRWIYQVIFEVVKIANVDVVHIHKERLIVVAPTVRT